MDIERLTPTELAALEALARYRFLIPAQMMRLGVTASDRHLYVALRALSARTRAPIGKLDFGALPGHGRLPVVYFLTRHGAELVEDLHGDGVPVAVPAHVRLFQRDYFHRLNTVDAHIAVRRWADRAGANLDLFDTYFDHGQTAEHGRPGARTRVALSTGRSLVPDAVLAFTLAGVTRVCAVEMVNGSRTARVEDQVGAYMHALAEGAIEAAYQAGHGVRVLLIFESEAGLELARARLAGRDALTRFASHFFLKTLSQLQADFVPGWRRLNGERSDLFTSDRPPGPA